MLWPWSSVPAPTRVHIEEVSPGDAVVFNDDHQEISAQVSGLRDGEEVALLVSTADGQVVDDRLVMTRIDDANHYRCELPPGSGGFQQDTFYRITAGDATTPQYKLEVQIAPTIIVDRIDYHFPPYTEKHDRTIKNQGDIKALEGTRVTIHATANMDIKEARIDLGCAGLQTLSMTTTGTKATGQFTLALDPDNTGKAQYDCYQILFTDINGHSVRRPVRYHIDVDPDLPPEIEIVEPQQRRSDGGGGWSTADSRTRLRSRLRLAARYAPGRTRRSGRTRSSETRPAGASGPHQAGKGAGRTFRRQNYIFRPAELNLKAGDIVHYWATAEDNKEPRPNHSDTAQAADDPHRRSRAERPARSAEAAEWRRRSAATKRKEAQSGRRAEQDGARAGRFVEQARTDRRMAIRLRMRSPRKMEKRASRRIRSTGDKDQGQPDNSGGPGKKKSSSDPSKARRAASRIPGEASDEPKKVNPETQQMRCHQEDRSKIKRSKTRINRTNPTSPAAIRRSEPGQQGNSPQQGNNQQGNPQQGGQQQGSDKGGGQQPQGNSGEKKDQGGTGNPQTQGGNSQPPGRQSELGSGPVRPATARRQGEFERPRQSEVVAAAGQFRRSVQRRPAIARQEGLRQSASGNQSSQQTAAARATSRNLRPARRMARTPAASRSPIRSRTAGVKGQQNESAGGSPKSEKPQPGSQQGKDNRLGGNPPNSEKKQPGGKGPGDESQLAQNGPKPEQKKPAGSGGSDSQSLPGG